MVCYGCRGVAGQLLQSDLCKWSAMPSIICASAGWSSIEALLAQLSQQAAAGVRPELLKLMEVGCTHAAWNSMH